ncbi:UNKNOWN [Stylonychia lemnae]|uniref:Ribosomal RNA large subunit methyltransferase K/L-like methyltransferase domain-containing protein n=1 Tax=Stylonychia lemnae TaxID=5949 RepID=A0A078A6W9_STYLE|nr:UNKNOWN [Stylonychia lemnae]|eukprot:CDW76469.1 UNKNOWN [Stylonychia lemnae]
MSATIFTYRLRPPVGLEKTLMKELKSLNLVNSKPRKLTGRKIIEVQGPEESLWKMMHKSRIAEDIQVRMTQPFRARGEKELEQNLEKLPWHCYLPNPQQQQEHMFKMPQTRAKTHSSKLYHTQLIRDILIKSMTEIQIKRDFKISLLKGMNGKGPQNMPYKQFKKQWLEKKERKEQDDIDRRVKEKIQESDDEEENTIDIDGHTIESTQIESEGKGRRKIKTLDEIKAELKSKIEFKKNLKTISRIQINIVKDRGEILVGTSYEDLHKHGYKPFVRWGVLKETLTAACILESNIIAKANHTGKLYLWDPFCGSGSFLIETLMMILEQPVRNFDGNLPFQYWPVHQREQYEKFKEELNDYQKMVKKDQIDIQIIGSDVSQKAIETSIKNCDHSDIEKLIQRGLVAPRLRGFINNPMIFSSHWPKYSYDENGEAATSVLMDFKQTDRNQLLSLYQGDFQSIGSQLASLTENFQDFTILTNVPYGEQSKEKQRHTDTDLQNIYRRFGKFIRNYPSLEKNTFVLAQSHHYGHKLSFEKFSNCGWSKELNFSNGGLSVHLLKFDMSQVSEVKQTLQAYKEIAAM